MKHDDRAPNDPHPIPTPRRGEIAAPDAREEPSRCFCGARIVQGYCVNQTCSYFYPEPPYDEDRLAHERAHARGRIS